MALGYCKFCDTLRTITQGPQKWGTRECHWYPINHYVFMHLCNKDAVDCYNLVKVFDNIFHCMFCGPVSADDVVERICPGIKKSI